MNLKKYTSNSFSLDHKFQSSSFFNLFMSRVQLRCISKDKPK